MPISPGRNAPALVRRLALLALWGLTLLPGAALAATKGTAPDAEKEGTRIVQTMLHTYRTLTSLEQTSRNDLEMNVNGRRSKTTALTRLTYRRPNRFVFQALEGDETIIIACNGKRLWIYSRSRGSYTVQTAPDTMESARHMMGVWGRSFWDAFAFLQGADPLQDALAVRLIGAAKLRGVPVHVVELKGGPTEMALSGSVTRLYVGTKDHLLHKSETVQKRHGYRAGPEPGTPPMNATRSITQTHEILKLNEPIPPEIFTFKPPRGASQVASF